MTGLVITGHGHFASGLKEAVKVIAGEPEHVEWVDFELTDSLEDLNNKLTSAFESLADCQGILVMADLAGGSPFKSAVQLGYPQGIQTVAGTNLGMVLETIMNAKTDMPVEQLAASAVQTAKDAAVWFTFNKN